MSDFMAVVLAIATATAVGIFVLLTLEPVANRVCPRIVGAVRWVISHLPRGARR